MSFLWSLRSRILYAIVLLVLLTVGSTLFVLQGKMKDAAARGDYLSKHMNRLLGFQDSIRGTVAFTDRILARDPMVRQAFEAPSDAMFQDVAEALRTELALEMPADVLCFLGPLAQPIGCSGELDKTIFSSHAFDEFRRGGFSTGYLEAEPAGVYLFAANPLKVSGEVYGGVFLASSAKHVYSDYKTQSDPVKEKQHELMFMKDGVVLSATFPKTDYAELTSAFGATDRKTLEGDMMVNIFDLRGVTRDYHSRDIQGYSAAGQGVLGQLIIFRTRESYQSRVWENLTPVLWVGFGGIAAAFLLAFLLAGTITRPIRRFRDMIQSLAAGDADLTYRLPIKGKDEIAQLGMQINNLLERLTSLVMHIRDSSLSLGQSAQEISLVSTRMLDGARDQVSRIDNSTSQANELSRTIQEIAQRATDGARMASDGKDSAESTDKGMSRLKKAIEEAWARVNKLEENVRNIGKIAEMINRITEENTVLALNASIEAARAGAAGQGFAVVAQEMQQQARRVERNSKDIIDNIQAVQTWTRESVKAMDTGRREVDKGMSLVNVTLHNLSEISAVMEETAEAVKEQAVASDDIVQMMREVQRIASEALQASQQSVEEGGAIRGRAQELSGLVSQFKVKSLPGETRDKVMLPPHGKDSRVD